MTYCVGIRVAEGLAFLSDSRTSAGVDQISTFRKMTCFERVGERAMVLLSAGNLAISQAVVSILQERLDTPESAQPNLMTVSNMFEAARLVGEALREVYRRDAAALREHGIDFNVSMIFGGQIQQEQPRLFNVYAAGNYVEATIETPYLQIGESKYGKPILDRVMTYDLSLAQAVKCALVSMDSTIRSNLSVGAPLDLVCIRRGQLKLGAQVNLDGQNDYYSMINRQWSESLRSAFQAMPDPDWL